MARTSKRVSKAKRGKTATTASAKKATKKSSGKKAKKVVKKAKAIATRPQRSRPSVDRNASPSHPSQTKASVAGTLFDEAKQYAKDRGYRLRPGAVTWFRDSAAKVAANGVDISAARAAYEKLIDAMIEESLFIQNYPPGGIGERTLCPALKRLCPLFPIC